MSRGPQEVRKCQMCVGGGRFEADGFSEGGFRLLGLPAPHANRAEVHECTALVRLNLQCLLNLRNRACCISERDQRVGTQEKGIDVFRVLSKERRRTSLRILEAPPEEQDLPRP